MPEVSSSNACCWYELETADAAALSEVSVELLEVATCAMQSREAFAGQLQTFDAIVGRRRIADETLGVPSVAQHPARLARGA